MTPGEMAETYLRAHATYVDALKALLGDLDDAWRRNERARCDLLCDAMIEMQRLAHARDDAKKSGPPDAAASPARTEK